MGAGRRREMEKEEKEASAIRVVSKATGLGIVHKTKAGHKEEDKREKERGKIID